MVFNMMVVMLVVISSLSARAGNLKAGAGRYSITPPASEFPYKPDNEDLSYVGVRHPVYARALVLDDGEQRVVVVLLEVTKVPIPQQLVAAAAKEAGIDESHVIIAATHTHNVLLATYHGGDMPSVIAREIERVRKGTIEAVREAVTNLEPAGISFSRGKAWVNMNNGQRSGLKTRYDPEGPSDKTLDIIRVANLNGEPIALLINYATHAEVMFRSVTKDNGYEVTGDIPGVVSNILEDNAVGAPVVLFSCGAEGDQLSLFTSRQPAGLLPATDEGSAGWALLNVQAHRLANSVLETLSMTSTGEQHVKLHASSGMVSCPGQKLRINPRTNEVTIEERPPVDIKLTVVRLNDIAIVGVAGDVASEIGTAIRAASPIPNTMLMTMLAGSVGYILSDASYEQPGHGVAGSPLKPGCAENALIEGINALINEE